MARGLDCADTRIPLAVGRRSDSAQQLPDRPANNARVSDVQRNGDLPKHFILSGLQHLRGNGHLFEWADLSEQSNITGLLYLRRHFYLPGDVHLRSHGNLPWVSNLRRHDNMSEHSDLCQSVYLSRIHHLPGNIHV